MTKKTTAPAPTGHVRTLTISFGLLLEEAIRSRMPEDEVDYEVAFHPLPTDTGFEPSLFLYLMLQPVGDVDGEHEGTFTSPYGLTYEAVDAFVTVFANRTAELRQKLRQARAEGIDPVPGVAVPGAPG